MTDDIESPALQHGEQTEALAASRRLALGGSEPIHISLRDLSHEAMMLSCLIEGIEVLYENEAPGGREKAHPVELRASNALPAVIEDAIARARRLSGALDSLETACRKQAT